MNETSPGHPRPATTETSLAPRPTITIEISLEESRPTVKGTWRNEADRERMLLWVEGRHALAELVVAALKLEGRIPA